MQFIAECGIEYGLQFVTQFFLNSPDCLYTKKSWEFLQSYEKNLSHRVKSKHHWLYLNSRKKQAKHKTTEIQEQTDGFIENQNALFEKMKKQQKFYKAVSITALAVSIASLLYGIIL